MVRFVFLVLLLLASEVAPAFGQAPSHVDVVALMVEFQPDTTRFTTGDGTYDGILFEGVESPSIDPLPHNDAYFKAHLRFLEHYVDRVSDGRMSVSTHVLPGLVRVSNPMGVYSPTGLDAGSDAELTKLSALVTEAWSLADQSAMSLPAGLDPATTAFIIFHAGVGRDIELVGTTLDKTPEDIPSIYFDQRALDRLGASGVTMDGIPVTNSLVIPRTESRLGVNPLTSDPFLIELSINGLLAASFFNYLGVPDLFNTETGDSAIGPFGLMDALGIFAYSGLFPPEPSAWTKQFLGWETEVRSLDGGSSGTHQLAHAGSPDQNDMARIPISSSEYFLVENRHRDPDEDGVRLNVWTHEGEQEVVFQNGDPEFNDQTVSGFPGGVVLSVDDYDFALPGGLDENNNPLLGGILIWHIDDNRLREGLPSNRVNADRNARAINLEEADGAQDIGFGSGASFFGPRFDLGTPFDFWFEGNPVMVRTSRGQDIRLYENRFAEYTEPSSLNNAGGESGVTLSNFSASAPIMTFDVNRGNAGELVAMEDGFLPYGYTRPSVQEGVLMVDAFTGLQWAWHDDVWVGPWTCSGQTEPIQPVVLGGLVFYITEEGFFSSGDSITSLTCPADALHLFPSGTRTWTTPSIEWVQVPGELRFYAGVEDQAGPGLMVVVVHEDGRVDHSKIQLPEPARFIFVEDRTSPQILIVTEAGVRDARGVLVAGVDLSGIDEAVMAGTVSDWQLAWTSDEQTSVVHLFGASGDAVQISPAGACKPAFPEWRDLDADGRLDLSFACDASIQAAHDSGAFLRGYPLSLDAAVVAQPIFGEDAAGSTVVVTRTAEGYVEGYRLSDSRWDAIVGFPFSAGTPINVPPLIDGNVVTILESNGTLQRWGFEMSNPTKAADPGRMVQQPEPIIEVDEGNRLLVGRETYNWPNPIVSGRTRIRFEVQEASSVEIDIVDMSGVLVDQMEIESASAGMPTEIIWQTDAGSGIYLARVKATAHSGGNSDTRLIRMAIIR